MLNLLKNAADAISDETNGTIRVRTVRSLNSVLITVEDNGTGIAPHAEDHLFEPFFTTKPAGCGTGLGLSICKRIINEGRGEINVSRSPSLGGARISISLPIEGETTTA